MKSLAHWLQVVVFDIGMAHDKIVFLTFINDRQHAVVRRYKILILGADKKRTTLRSHTGIHNHDVDGLRRKVGIRRANRQGSVEQIKRRDVVRDVHDGYVGIDLPDYALQRSDQMVVGAVVSCERNDRVGQWILSSGMICAWRADGSERRSASFDANGGARRRQEFARRLLCNRQWVIRRRNQQRISLHPVPVRMDASRGQENEPGNTIDRSARKTAERCGRRVHPRAKLPDRVVPWVLRLLRSSHPPRREGRCSREEASADAFHYANFVHAAASNIHPPVGRRRHIAYHAATRRNGGAREFVRLRIELNNRVWLYFRFAVPDHSVRSNRNAVGA